MPKSQVVEESHNGLTSEVEHHVKPKVGESMVFVYKKSHLIYNANYTTKHMKDIRQDTKDNNTTKGKQEVHGPEMAMQKLDV